MALPPLLRQLVDMKLEAYCEARIPERVRDRYRLEHEVRGNHVTLVERRVPLLGGGDWTRSPVAQLRFDAKRGLWTLYCADRNGKWHRFDPSPPSPELDELIADIDRDDTGIFWG